MTVQGDRMTSGIVLIVTGALLLVLGFGGVAWQLASADACRTGNCNQTAVATSEFLAGVCGLIAVAGAIMLVIGIALAVSGLRSREPPLPPSSPPPVV